MNWPEAIAIVGGAFAFAFLLGCFINGGFPEIHIHKYYTKKKKDS